MPTTRLKNGIKKTKDPYTPTPARKRQKISRKQSPMAQKTRSPSTPLSTLIKSSIFTPKGAAWLNDLNSENMTLPEDLKLVFSPEQKTPLKSEQFDDYVSPLQGFNFNTVDDFPVTSPLNFPESPSKTDISPFWRQMMEENHTRGSSEANTSSLAKRSLSGRFSQEKPNSSEGETSTYSSSNESPAYTSSDEERCDHPDEVFGGIYPQSAQ